MSILAKGSGIDKQHNIIDLESSLEFSMNFSATNGINSLALQTRHLHKFYGVGRGAFHVLKGVDMDVPYGTM